jgi:squalene-hopene/tetraprenyl-beta-curcumene cyclase
MTLTETDVIATRTEAARALDRARAHLLSLQHADGYWKGDLETNVTMDAEDMLLREFLEIRDSGESARSAAWIRRNQRDDGTWANFYGGPGDLSTTIEAYVALRIAGDAPDEPHMARASAWVRSNGGLERARVFTKVWLALFGLWPWLELPAVPPELIFVPASVPLSIYDFGCWARQTVVAIAVVFAYRPVRPLGFGIEELRSGEPPARPKRSLANWRGRFLLLDDALQVFERLVRRSFLRMTVREAALRACERWVIKRQEADGGWGGIQPPWVYSILALHLRGYGVDHPVMAKAFQGLESFMVRDGETRWLEACQSPVWDTALATIALSDAGLGPDEPALRRAGEWLLSKEVRLRGDWAVRKPGLEPGGWSFEFANENYPDVDDTAEVVLALRRVHLEYDARFAPALSRGVRWTEGMVCSNGAWGAFDADNLREILYDLPFCDFGAVIDPPSADVTAHVIEMLAAEPDVDRVLIDRGLAWLLAEQEKDGAWFGRWGVNYVYGTGAVVPALVAAGLEPAHSAIVRAIEFLEAHQNDDGGWGEDIRSYDDPSLRGQGASTASQTAWALLAFIAAGRAQSPAACRGVEFLVKTQRDNGTWDEPFFTGTGFPRFFYINYHLYRLVFPVSALGRWCAALGVARTGDES